MATHADITQLEQKLMGTVSLTWVVPGQPVVAVFSNPDSIERDYLGHPSPHNQVSDSLLLWIGLNEQTGHLLITLTQRIKVSTTARGRLMFLIVPSESLVVKSAAPAFWALSEQNVPLTLLDKPSDERSAQTSRLLQVSFSLDTKSKVIMPAQKYSGRVRPQPMSLLHKLKTLSELSYFDVFTTHNSWTQLGLLKTEQILQREHVTTTTPVVDLTALYPGERDGGIDLWTEQGWYDQDKIEKPKSVLRKHYRRGRCAEPATKKHRKFSPSPPPPPYEPQSRPPPSAVGGVATAAAAAATAVTATTDAASAPHCAPDHAPAAQAVRVLAPLFTPTPVPVPVSDIEPPCPSVSAIHGTVSDPVLTLSSPLPLMTSIHEHAPAPAVTSASNFHAILQSPVQPHYALDRRNADEQSDSFVPETPIATTRARSSIPISAEQTVDPSIRRVTLEPPPHVMLDNQISLWLIKAWEACPYAHYIFITKLLMLGAAARTSDAKAFHTSRVSCMDALLSYCAKEELAKPLERAAFVPAVSRGQAVSAKRHIVSIEIPALISWLLILDSTADIKFFPSLKRLAVMKEQLLQLCESETEDEYCQSMTAFIDLKAVIVTEACVQLGSQVLGQNKSIASTMMREKELVQANTMEL